MGSKATAAVSLTRVPTTLDLVTLEDTIGEGFHRDPLLALSQRKLNALGLALAYIDRGLRFRFANKAFLDTLGKRSDQVHGRLARDVLGPEVFAYCQEHLDRALRGEHAGFECQLPPHGTSRIWIRIEYYPDRSPRGEIRGVLATYTDVDHIKRLELDAIQREHRLRLVTDGVGAPILHFDRKQTLCFANKPFAERIGVQVADLVGCALAEVMAADAQADMQPYIERAFAGDTVSYERRERTSTDELRWVRTTLFPDHGVDGGGGGAIAVLTDIEDDVVIREALKAQEQQLRLFADNIPGPIAYLDRSMRYTFVNQAFANWCTKPQHEIRGRTPFDVMPPDVAAFIRPILERGLDGEQFDYERVGRTTDGPRRWIHGRIVPDRDAVGKIRGIYCTEYDIHDLKRTEQALAAREEQLRLFTDNIPEPVVYLDRDLRYVFVNESFLRLTGMRREDVIGKTAQDVIGIEAKMMLAPARERALHGEASTYERSIVDKHGRSHWIRGRIVPDLKFDGSVKGLYIVGHDITDLKQTQDALAARESQLRAIMDGVPAPVAYIDRDERCHYVNRPFLQYFGMTKAQLSTLRLRDVLGQRIYESAHPMLARALQGESTSFDRLLPGANGVRRWMTIRVVPDVAASGDVHGAFVLMNDIHGLKEAQEALRASEAELSLIMDNVPARVSYIDRDYRYRFLNRHNEEWLGEDRQTLAGRHVADVLGAERTRQLQPLLERVLAGEVVATERLLAQPSGPPAWESIHYAPNRDSEGRVIGIYAAHTNINEQKRNEEALRRANWMLSSHINNTPLAVLEWDRDFRLVRWSPRAETIFGWRAEEALGMPLDGEQFIHESDRGTVVALLNTLMNGDEPRATGVTRNYRKDGGTIWCEWYHSCLLDDAGQIVSILSFVQDVSSRIQAEERLQYLATRDSLTGLPNRVLLQERLAQAIAQAKRDGGRVGVLFIDLDRFKNVNDTLGHRIGDELLKQVTTVLAGALRETDLLARLGGDEFMVIVEGIADPSALSRIAVKLQEATAKPFTVEANDIYVTSSIGISVFPDDSDDPEELLKHADVAMYRSKELGRNTYQFFDADLAARRLRQHALEPALRVALQQERLSLCYQPVVRLSDGAVIGAEALLRWNHPVHGDVSPRVFVPLAEESGLIHALGDWVLRCAAAQCAAWHAAGLPLTVSVNLSGRQFHRDDLVARMSSIVRSVQCDPRWIELEVTETSLLQDLDAIRNALTDLRREGFTVAIDDFGTGFSSLTHLKHFPIDSLKIDVSFITDIETDAGDAAITEAIIGLARGLGLAVVAEGVETNGQLDFLVARDCHMVQGFWFSKALTAVDFEAFVRARH